MLFSLCFNHTHHKQSNVTVLNLNRNLFQKCNYSCPLIIPLFLSYKTEHIPDGKGKDGLALPVLSTEEKSLSKKSALTHPCLWMRPLKVAALLQPSLNVQTGHPQNFLLFTVSRTCEEEVGVEDHNTWCHKPDIYESLKRFLVFFQPIKNANRKPSCSCSKGLIGSKKRCQRVSFPPQRTENMFWK